jgi:hypothetical protein
MDGPAIDLRELRVALARRDVPQWRLAADLGVCPSTLSSYLHGRYPSPGDLRQRIERALGLPEHCLTPTEERQPGQAGVRGEADAPGNPHQ